MKLSASQQAVFDEEIPGLRERLELRRRFMDLPTTTKRKANAGRLLKAVEKLRKAGAPFVASPATYFSNETQNWLTEADAVAEEISNRLKSVERKSPSRSMRKPNEYREWLIGDEITALCEKVFGKPFANYSEGWAVEFAHYALEALGEKKVESEAIKKTVSNARGRGKARLKIIKPFP